MSTEKHGRGVIASLYVHADLIKRGYQVFTEDTGQGLIDLIAVHLTTGETRYIDVKCISRRANGTIVNRTLKENQIEFEESSGLRIEIVYADTETYEIRYPTRRNKTKKIAA